MVSYPHYNFYLFYLLEMVGGEANILLLPKLDATLTLDFYR